MPMLWARAGPSKANRMPSITPAYMAKPPRSGMGFRWTLRGPGRSTIPTRIANARTGTTRSNDADEATRKASRPALINALIARSDGTSPGETASTYTETLPVWDPAPKSEARKAVERYRRGSPTQPQYDNSKRDIALECLGKKPLE